MATDLQTILELTVPVIVRIGERRVPVEEVLALAPGAILELPKTADEELDLLANNKPIAAGSAVKVGENFGIRVTHVGSARDRMAAMTGSHAAAQAASVALEAAATTADSTDA